MDLYREYLHFRKGAVILLSVFSGIYLVSFVLSQIPVVVFAYPFFICLLLGVGYAAWDFSRFKDRHNRLEQMEGQEVFDPSVLPEPESILEEDYHSIIQFLLAEKYHMDVVYHRKYDEMMDYFTIWVHQIKTPISSMHLMMQEQDSDFSRGLKMELLEVEQYVEMVLCYLRLDSETTDYQIKQYDLDAIVKQEIKKLAPQFIRKKIKLEYDALNCHIVTDEKWLAFVVGQIMSNAVKYTREGSICITLEPPATLCIRDTGIGIAPEDLPRIFEKGYTGFNGRIDKRASGIGLYLCQRICKNLGHRLTVESVVDQGTVVRIGLDKKRLEFE